MSILFNNEKLIEEFSKKSKELAKQNYNREIYYNKLEKIYEDLIKEK